MTQPAMGLHCRLWKASSVPWVPISLEDVDNPLVDPPLKLRIIDRDTDDAQSLMLVSGDVG